MTVERLKDVAEAALRLGKIRLGGQCLLKVEDRRVGPMSSGRRTPRPQCAPAKLVWIVGARPRCETASLRRPCCLYTAASPRNEPKCFGSTVRMLP